MSNFEVMNGAPSTPASNPFSIPGGFSTPSLGWLTKWSKAPSVCTPKKLPNSPNDEEETSVQDSYKERLELDSTSFMLAMSKPPASTATPYLDSFLSGRNLDYLLDLLGHVLRTKERVAALQVLGRAARYLALRRPTRPMEFDAPAPKKFKSSEVRQRPGHVKKLVAGVKKRVSSVFHTVRPKLSQPDPEEVPMNISERVAEVLSSGDFGYYFVARRAETLRQHLLASSVQLLWLSKTPSLKACNDELEDLNVTQGRPFLVNLLFHLCALDPEILREKTNSDVDLVCGLLLDFLGGRSAPGGRKRNHLTMSPSAARGRLYQFKLPQFPDIAAWE